MNNTPLKYIFGPVYSWRIGMSLGIDPISSEKKICNFDCVYCQLGRSARLYGEREEFVAVDDIIAELRTLPPLDIDYYTFSGRGEPTLAKNLGVMIDAVRAETGGKIAVITNAALINRPDVQEDLARADYVLAKLDACSEEGLRAINVAGGTVCWSSIVDGLKSFRKKFDGRYAVQIMFIERNKRDAQGLARIVKEINPDEIQLNTPLRPSGAPPLNEQELVEIKAFFDGIPSATTSVYEAERRDIKPLDDKQTARRHGNVRK